MSTYKDTVKKRKHTPQRQPIPGRETEMAKNNAGGYVFQIEPLAQVRRFLILGSEGGTYYTKAPKLTAQNVKVLTEELNGPRGIDVVNLIQEVSTQNLAPRVSPTLFALAFAFASQRVEVRMHACNVFYDVVRTHSHLLEFVGYVYELRGGGRLLNKTIANWYNKMSAGKLMYQLAKYRNRNDWTTRDVLRKVKPSPSSDKHDGIYDWATGNKKKRHKHPVLLCMLDELRDDKPLPDLIEKYNLTWEMLPTQWLKNPDVWRALLPHMPLTAMIRNLGRMSALGLFKQIGSAETAQVITKLEDEDYLRRSRIHPFGVLLAHSTYTKGRGVRGSLSWEIDADIAYSLNKAYYKTFQNVEPSGSRTLIALDISYSMASPIMNTHLSAQQASAAMAQVTVATEPKTKVVAFANGPGGKLPVVPLNKGHTLDRVNALIKDTLHKHSFTGTDCALPMIYAVERGLEVDHFVIYTDNETWAGRRMHPSQALTEYRKRLGIPAKLTVVGMTSTGFSIADPKDAGMLDVVGFDASAPRVISEFAGGKV